MLVLPESLRSELKSPLGPVLTDTEKLLSAVDGPLVSVGDIVTYHLETAGRTPDVALFDARTKREPVDDTVGATLAEADVRAENPPGTLTEELLSTLRTAIDTEDPVRIRVDGEEDLAALPAILAVPEGTSVVYGQPDEGMVHVRVTPERRERPREILARMDGNTERAFEILVS